MGKVNAYFLLTTALAYGMVKYGPEELRPYARATREPVPHEYAEDELEPLVEHAAHCEDCNTLMQEAILRGERVDNIVVPKHDEAGIMELLEDIKKAKLPFIIPKNNIIH